jgi:hypothetical protein
MSALTASPDRDPVWRRLMDDLVDADHCRLVALARGDLALAQMWAARKAHAVDQLSAMLRDLGGTS